MERLLVYNSEGVDISDELELKDGKSNPFGWSQHKLVHVHNVNGAKVEDFVGWLESGSPMNFTDGYTYKIEKVTDT